jgi:hypothetical protein
MLYNVYKTINDAEYQELEQKLIILEGKMKDILTAHNFYITLSVAESDALAIDFTKQENNFYGNVGIKFDDVKDRKTFSLYIAKAVDIENIRFYRNEHLLANRALEYIRENILNILDNAIRIYNSWGIEELKNSNKTDIA